MVSLVGTIWGPIWSPVIWGPIWAQIEASVPGEDPDFGDPSNCGPLEPVVVTSDLSAARPSFVLPRPCKLVGDNSSGSGRMVNGGALILVGVHYCIVADAADEGFILNHVDYAGTVTPVFRRVAAAAGTLEGSAELWVPFQEPSRSDLTSGATARNGGKLTLTLVGTPTANSHLLVEMRHHHVSA